MRMVFKNGMLMNAGGDYEVSPGEVSIRFSKRQSLRRDDVVDVFEFDGHLCKHSHFSAWDSDLLPIAHHEATEFVAETMAARERAAELAGSATASARSVGTGCGCDRWLASLRLEPSGALLIAGESESREKALAAAHTMLGQLSLAADPNAPEQLREGALAGLASEFCIERARMIQLCASSAFAAVVVAVGKEPR